MWSKSLEVLNPYEATLQQIALEHELKMQKRRIKYNKMRSWFGLNLCNKNTERKPS